jgi:tetratricopeptide (TPR) repeat protein
MTLSHHPAGAPPDAPPDKPPTETVADTARLRMAAAAAHMNARDYDAAILAYESAVDLAPDQPRPRYQLAIACALAGKRERALANLAGAVQAGFRQPDQLEAEPAFAGYRTAPTFVSSLALARRNQAPCADDPAHRVFDFFAGDWSAETPDGTVVGTNRIEVILGGAALIERWTSVHGYAGTSLNRLDPATGTWRQTWVDDQGDVVEFVDGRYADGAMRFVAHRDGVERRLTFFHLGSDALRQLSEQSEDGGVTWSIEYDLRYRRLGIGDDAPAASLDAAGGGPDAA